MDYYKLEAHPLAAIFPMIEGDAFNDLVDDIRQNGIRIPIMLCQGKILDGRNRYRAAIQCGHRFTDKDFSTLAGGLDPEGYVISANLQRRSLDNKGKRSVIAQLIERYPNESDRWIGRKASVDPKTVAGVRKDIADRAADFIRRLDELTPSQCAKIVAERRDKLAAMLAVGS